MAAAAHALIDGLDDGQRTKLQFDLGDSERETWFYTPVDHGGLPLLEMSVRQQQLAHRLLACALSEAGYNTASVIMGLENVLDRREQWRVSFDRERGRDPLQYFVSIFGDPDGDAWAWQFGGHHVSINVSLVGGEVASVSPLFLGANPASAPLLGPHSLRPLEGAEDLARSLVVSLDDQQQGDAIVSTIAPPDILSGNLARVSDGAQSPTLAQTMRGPYNDAMQAFLDEFQTRLEAQLGWNASLQESMVFSPSPVGLRAANLTASQQDGLKALLNVYVERLPDQLAEQQQSLVSGVGFSSLHLAWAGPTEVGAPHYYRLQNERVLIEYDNVQNDANHVHTVWRDLHNDFGGDALAAHYLRDHDHQ